MSNLIRTSTGLRLTWRQGNSKGTEKLHFTLHGPNKEIGKAAITADQIAGFVLRNSVLKEQDETDNKRLQALYKEIDTLLNMAPCEEDCTYEENAMYSDMANLKNSLFDVIQGEK